MELPITIITDEQLDNIDYIVVKENDVSQKLMKDVPQVSLTIRSSSKQQHSTFLEGDDVRFTCDVKANPSANEVGWLFDGKPLNPDDPELITSYRSLLIRRVKRKHRGRYQCYANNAEGTGMSRVINLRAMCKYA
ncbi:uncharacterized protein CDAR_291911 [Caerostris darwini]|uniref:Ig-like domain-containing protein n=1 Tax=Caerostris darwini TaxID=1538125 RepID=A0AAV4NYB2_9ARAC|nr:uncharacterized protein CDAR_291911 [Caerostris darwini]